MSTGETYIPYETLANEIEAENDSTEMFVSTLFPGATEHQITMVKLFATGKILAGINQGLELTDPNPGVTTEAYTFGYDEGYTDAMEEAVKDEEGES